MSLSLKLIVNCNALPYLSSQVWKKSVLKHQNSAFMSVSKTSVILMSNKWISFNESCSPSQPDVLHGKNFNVGLYMQTFQPSFLYLPSVYAPLTSTILYHFHWPWLESHSQHKTKPLGAKRFFFLLTLWPSGQVKATKSGIKWQWCPKVWQIMKYEWICWQVLHLMSNIKVFAMQDGHMTSQLDKHDLSTYLLLKWIQKKKKKKRQ